MAASFGRLLALAIAMFCASFFAGHLPLSVTLSERAMAFTTVFGAGMIVGTALVVILPEGVETLAASQAQKTRVESNQSGHQHRKRDSRLAEKAVPELSPRSPWPQPLPAETTPSPPNPPPATAPATGGSEHDHDHEHEHEHEHEEPRLNRMIGTSLLAGFVTMFLIEQIQARTAHVHHASNPGAAVAPADSSSSSGLPQPLPTSDPDELDLDEVSSRNHLHRGTSPSRRPARTTSDDATNLVDSRTHMLSSTSQPNVTYVHHHSQPTPHAHHQVGTGHSHSHSHSHSHAHPHQPGGPSYSSASGQSVLAATIGLVIHSFSDGVAMGAASAAALPALETAVFLAILLHKGPSAFGLTTYLMHHGTVSTRRIRSHLLAFSLAAPLAAITTFLALRGGGGNDRDIAKWTGLLLLFSAGSFLYVATVHVLPEVLARRGGHLSAGQVAAMVVGMMVPILIQVDHHH